MSAAAAAAPKQRAPPSSIPSSGFHVSAAAAAAAEMASLAANAKVRMLSSRLGRLRSRSAGSSIPEIGEAVHPDVKIIMARMTDMQNQRIEKLKEESTTAHELQALIGILQLDTLDDLKSAQSAVNASRHPGNIAYHEATKHDISNVRTLVQRLGRIKKDLLQLNVNEQREMERKRALEMQLVTTSKLGSFREWFGKNGKSKSVFKGLKSEFHAVRRRVPNWGMDDNGQPQEGTQLAEMMRNAKYNAIFAQQDAAVPGRPSSSFPNLKKLQTVDLKKAPLRGFTNAHPGYYPPFDNRPSTGKVMVSGRIYG